MMGTDVTLLQAIYIMSNSKCQSGHKIKEVKNKGKKSKAKSTPASEVTLGASVANFHQKDGKNSAAYCAIYSGTINSTLVR